MKQITECLDRFFDKKEPLRKKWIAVEFREDDHFFPGILQLFHYHHTILLYDIENHKVIYQWWEKPADKRGLDAALDYLERRKSNL